MQITQDNHLQFGWGDGTFNFEEQNKHLWVHFQKIHKPIGNFKEECLKCAKLLGEQWMRDIYLCLSGGIDSEIIAHCFVEENIPFTALICGFEDKKNFHDIQYAYDFTKEYNIPHIIYEVNVNYMIEKAMKNNVYVTDNLFNFFQMELLQFIRKIKGFGILGSGEPRIWLENGKITIPFGNKNTSIYHWKFNHQYQCVPAFFLHIPGIIRSFLREPIFDAVLKGGYPISPLGHNVKLAIYKKYWPMLKIREKYSGFERFIVERRDFKLTKIKQYGNRLQDTSISMEELV